MPAVKYRMRLNAKLLFGAGLLFLGVTSARAQNDDPVVDTIYGPVRGNQQLDSKDRPYDSFIGIPFAAPPVDSLRWQRPIPPTPWIDTLNVTEYTPHCIQPITVVYPLAGLGGEDSEDCLYLNVFVPQSVEYARANNLPVMVFYYGGGFQIGTGEMYPNYELATEGDVIGVVINYRVSSMGFFSTGDSAAPGNYGLWDTKASLEWVRDNIAAFGGDPGRVTIFGQSAGGWAVAHNIQSPETNTLFHRGIAMSGGSVYMERPELMAEYIGDIFSCNTSDSQALVDCLRPIPAKELDNAIYLSNVNDSFSVRFYAVIDGEFLTENVRDSWSRGVGSHIDFMTGYTYHDSAGFVVRNPIALPLPGRPNNGNMEAEDLYDRWMKEFYVYENQQEIVQTLYDRFPLMNSSDPETATISVTEVDTDWSFATPTFYNVEKHAEAQGAGSTYFYEFRHRLDFVYYPDWVNGSHMDDLYCVLGHGFFQDFRETYLRTNYSENDLALEELLMHYYSNFAYTGDPNTGQFTMPVQWPQYDVTNRQYLLQTPTPAVLSHDQVDLDNYNWYLYDFWSLMRPNWGPIPYGGAVDDIEEYYEEFLLSDEL